ncbi:hypothetical protein DITRI_Ditri16bG0012200 [Diplodiscus trichospermus]
MERRGGEEEEEEKELEKEMKIPKVKSCTGLPYYSSVLKSKNRDPHCIGILLKSHGFSNLENDLKASGEMPITVSYKYLCTGYSAFMSKNGDSVDKGPNLTYLLVMMLLRYAIRIIPADTASASGHPQTDKPTHAVEDRDACPSQTGKSTHGVEDFLNRFTRNANLVDSRVVRDMHRVGNTIKKTVEDILFPHQRPPKFEIDWWVFVGISITIFFQSKFSNLMVAVAACKRMAEIGSISNLWIVGGVTRFKGVMCPSEPPTFPPSAIRLSASPAPFPQSRQISQLVKSNGKQLFLVDTLALIEMTQESNLSKLKSEVQSSQAGSLAPLQIAMDSVDMSRLLFMLYEIDKVTAGHRFDLNLERGRIQDELSNQKAGTSNLTNKFDREIHALRADLEAAKYDLIKYCIGTLVSISAVGLAAVRILM